MSIEDGFSSREWMTYCGYYIGMLGFFISGAIVGTVIFPSLSIWKYGLAALVVFSAIWMTAILYGLKHGYLSKRNS